MNNFKNPINPTDNQSLGVAIQKLIEDNLKRINTSFLAKIESINGGGLVDVVDIINQREDIPNPVIPNAIYGVPSSGLWSVSHNAKVGDIGLAIVLKSDINVYKTNKKGGNPNTKRFFDVNDCIFIPLSLLNFPSSDNYSIESEDKKVNLILTKESVNITCDKSKINIDKDISLAGSNSKLELKEKIKLSNNSSGLKDVLDDIVGFFKTATYGGYPLDPPAQTALEQVKIKIGSLLE